MNEKSVVGPSLIDYYSDVKQEIKEEVLTEMYEEGVEDSKLDTDNLVDCSEYVKVQMNLSE